MKFNQIDDRAAYEQQRFNFIKIDVIAPFGSVEEVVKDLKTNTSLAGKTTRMLGPKVGEEQGIIEF